MNGFNRCCVYESSFMYKSGECMMKISRQMPGYVNVEMTCEVSSELAQIC